MLPKPISRAYLATTPMHPAPTAICACLLHLTARCAEGCKGLLGRQARLPCAAHLAEGVRRAEEAAEVEADRGVAPDRHHAARAAAAGWSAAAPERRHHHVVLRVPCGRVHAAP